MCISLRPYTYFMRSNVNLGSFGVTGVKRTFSAKMLPLLQNTWCYLYVTQCIYVAHKYALTWVSLLHSMGQGQLEITSSGRVRHLWWQMCLVTLSEYPTGSCILLVSLPCRTFGRVLYLSCFFFLSFCHSFWLITPTCLDRFWPYLVTTTYTLTATCHVTSMGPKVT